MPHHHMPGSIFVIRAGWFAGCVLAIGVGAVRLALAWPSLAFVHTQPMASSDLFLADRPGASSKVLAELVANRDAVMVGSASDPGATGRLFLVSYLALPRPLPGVTCGATRGKLGLLIAGKAGMPSAALYDSVDPPSSGHILARVSPRLVAVDALTPESWNWFCSQ